jgi:two-component system sensor histidine kinase EvgS
VAHDFNNLTAIVLGYGEMLLGQLPPEDPARRSAEQIVEAGRRSAALTRQLLAFSRRQVLQPVVLDLNGLLRNLEKMLGRLIGEDIDLVWRPAAEVWPVKIDPAQVDQILANLCVNARDAIADMGKITIETGQATLDAASCAEHDGCAPGEYVLLAVSDNGRGMEKEVLAHVFEPFFTTKGVGEGTGLGLATVYGIVRQNSGFISIASEPEKGTSFRLYLPRHEGAIDEMRPESEVETPYGCGERVLLVEDDRAIREMSEKMLENLGYLALAAGTPGEAMRLADEHAGDIDLLITDVVLPEMNGRDLADRLHASHPKLRTLFMSGYTANIVARQGVFGDGVPFMQKPFTLKELALKVHEALGRR